MQPCQLIHHTAASMISNFRLDDIFWRCHNKSSIKTASVATCRLHQSILWKWGQLIVAHTLVGNSAESQVPMFSMKMSILETRCWQDTNFLLHLVVKKEQNVIVTHLQMPPERGGSAHNRRFSDTSPSAVLVDKESRTFTRENRREKYPSGCF